MKRYRQDNNMTSPSEDVTSVFSDNEGSSEITSHEDENDDISIMSDDGDVENDENICQPVVTYISSNRTTPLFIFRPEAVVSEMPEHRNIAEKYRLTYKQGKSTCRLVKNLMEGHGFRETDQEGLDYNLCWMGSHVKPHFLSTMQSFQRVNHFPRSFEITRKDRLYKNIQKMQQAKGFKNFDFVPQTYCLPYENQEFMVKSYKDRCTWIIKPAALSRGRGIFMTTNPDVCLITEKAVACRYINNPFLINGFKFDIRLYVAVTSFDPLVIYLYEEGLTRFATIPFDNSSKSISNTCMHLTNYSVNKRSKSFISNKDSEVENHGSKWTLGALLRYLKQKGHDTTALMMSIEDVIIKTMIAGEGPIATACKSTLNFRANCFELFGFDILLDENLKPWVLEVNLSPSLACDAPLDLKVKSNMMSDLLNLVGFECQDPVVRRSFANLAMNKMKNAKVGKLWWRKKLSVHLSNARISKKRLLSSKNHSLLGMKSLDYTNNDQLSMEDQKLLLRFKDEFERRGKWARIFPTETTWDTYSGLFLTIRPNNIILHRDLMVNRTNSSTPETQDINDKTNLEYNLVSSRCEQYERCLPVLSSSSSTLSLKKKNILVQQQVQPDVNDDLKGQHEVISDSEVKGHEEVKHVAVMKQENLKNLMLFDGFSLSHFQARRVFSTYLKQLTSRSSKNYQSDDTDAIVHFLRNAGGRLCHGFVFNEPQATMTNSQKKLLVESQLLRFIAAFNEESLNLEKQQINPRKVKDETHRFDNQVLESFIEKASKSDLEVIFNLYTEQELNRSNSASTNQKPRLNCDSSHKGSVTLNQKKCHKKSNPLLDFSEDSSPTKKVPASSPSSVKPKPTSGKSEGRGSTSETKLKMNANEAWKDLTSDTRYKGTMEKLQNIIFSSSGIFKVNEMGSNKIEQKEDSRINSVDRSEEFPRFVTDRKTSANVRGVEFKETSLDEKNKKKVKVTKAWPDPDQSREECEVITNLETLDSLKNLSLDRSPHLNGTSIEKYLEFPGFVVNDVEEY